MYRHVLFAPSTFPHVALQVGSKAPAPYARQAPGQLDISPEAYKSGSSANNANNVHSVGSRGSGSGVHGGGAPFSPPEVSTPEPRGSGAYSASPGDYPHTGTPHTPATPPSADSRDGRLDDSMAKSIVMSEQLEALTQRVPIAGQTVSAIIRLMDLCVAARPVAQNARELARLCLDVVDLIEDLVDVENVLNEDLFKVRAAIAPSAAARL